MRTIFESYGVRVPGKRYTTIVYGKAASEHAGDSGDVVRLKRPFADKFDGRRPRTVTVTSRREYEGLVGINGQLF